MNNELKDIEDYVRKRGAVTRSELIEFMKRQGYGKILQHNLLYDDRNLVVMCNLSVYNLKTAEGSITVYTTRPKPSKEEIRKQEKELCQVLEAFKTIAEENPDIANDAQMLSDTSWLA